MDPVTTFAGTNSHYKDYWHEIAMPRYTDQSPPTSDKAPKIALVAVAVVALLVVIGVFFRINNSEQSRSVNPASTQTFGDNNTRQ